MTRPDARTVRRGLAVLGRAIRIEPWPFAWSVGGAAVYAAMTVGSSVVVGRVTDRVLLPAVREGRVTARALAVAAAVIVAVGALKAVGIVLRRVGASVMQFRLHARFRRLVADRYLRLPLAWHRRHPTGELLSVLNADVEAAFGSIAPLPFACGVLVLLVVAAGMLVATDPVLALVGLALAPAVWVLNRRYTGRMAGPAMRAQEHRASVSAVAHESVDGALVVKTLGLAQAETERFRAEADRLRDALVEVGRIRAGFDPLLDAVPALTTLAVLLTGALRVGAGAITVGELVQVAFLFTLIAFPLRIIGYLLSELPRSVVGWERIGRVLAADGGAPDANRRRRGVSAPPVTRSGSAHTAPGGPGGPAAVTLDRVGFTYPGTDTEVLVDVDLDLSPGRTVALVGPTGAGKSTLASLLVRLSDPDRGAVLVDGVDLRDLAPGALPATAALVFQQAFLFDDTVRGNVTLGGPFPDDEVVRACRLAQADGFIRALPSGYDTLVGERGASLSGGQRQRIALARALVRRPRLLVLDDATSAVDPSVEAAILRGLRAARLPATMLLITARSATIALADEVVVLDGGRVRAQGAHATLLATDPAYAALIRSAGGATTAGTAA